MNLRFLFQVVLGAPVGSPDLLAANAAEKNSKFPVATGQD
jgi:hypothetical protein